MPCMESMIWLSAKSTKSTVQSKLQMMSNVYCSVPHKIFVLICRADIFVLFHSNKLKNFYRGETFNSLLSKKYQEATLQIITNIPRGIVHNLHVGMIGTF